MDRVRVGIRIRGGGEEIFSIEQRGDKDWSLNVLGDKIGKKGDSKFLVDYAFSARKNQSDVWSVLREDLMSGLFDSRGHVKFGVTVMAYGQTGSGKTYTMLGERCQETSITNGSIISKLPFA